MANFPTNHKPLVILNADAGTVHIVMHFEESAEEALQAWCEENEVRENDCQWMTFNGNIQFQQLGAE